jgi:four helix bundle protein
MTDRAKPVQLRPLLHSEAGGRRGKGEGEKERTFTLDARRLRVRAGRPITYHWELEVYQLAMEAATAVFKASRAFPSDEKYSLTSQIRDSSRSVTAQIAEGWRRRRYEASFVSKLNDAEGEAAETQSWLEHAVKCEYLPRDTATHLFHQYDQVIGKLVSMQNNPKPWLLTPRHKRIES